MGDDEAIERARAASTSAIESTDGRERDGESDGRGRAASGKRRADGSTGRALEPFRHRVRQDSEFVESTLRALRDGTTKLLRLETSGLSFEALYGSAYALVLRKQGDALYDAIFGAVTDHLCQHVAISVANVAAEGDVEFLKALETGFLTHRKGTQMLVDVFNYLDRVHLPRSGKANLEPVGKLSMTLWRECVVGNPRIKRRMRSCVLDLIRRERDGERIDRDTLRQVTDMLRGLGESVYVEEFESNVLEETKSYYKALAQKRIDIDDCPTYLKLAETRIDQERDRSEAYMAPTTTTLLVAEVRQQLLKEMSQSLLHNTTSGMVHMLRTSQLDSLSCLYKLFSAMDDLEGIRDLMFEHIKDVGKGIVNDSENEKNPAQFVEELLKYKGKYDDILRVAFANSRVIESQCNQAYQYVANLNPRSPEYMSLYLDQVLRKSPKEMSQNELENIFNRSMGLFRLFHEKDVFEGYYRLHLSRRLLNKRSASDDNELAFIARLKDECGYTFTSKMESMFSDMLTSGDLNREFHETKFASGTPLDASFSVLTTGVWPMRMQKSHPFLPSECEAACAAFEAFYLGRHAGRKIYWQSAMGQAEIKFTVASGEYDLITSTRHMCVLMLFNRHNVLTTAQISQLTLMHDDELKACLQALSCVKGKNVLKRTPDGKEVLPTDTFEVNEDFSSKSSRVKISTISSRRENDHERASKSRQLSDDRKYQVEATIVRVMKAKKRLSHNDIVVEVTAQVKNRFMPTPADIKKYIEGLVEKDYIRRDPNDRRLYEYVA